jgi:hypothetical protein
LRTQLHGETAACHLRCGAPGSVNRRGWCITSPAGTNETREAEDTQEMLAQWRGTHRIQFCTTSFVTAGTSRPRAGASGRPAGPRCGDARRNQRVVAPSAPAPIGGDLHSSPNSRQATAHR